MDGLLAVRFAVSISDFVRGFRPLFGSFYQYRYAGFFLLFHQPLGLPRAEGLPPSKNDETHDVLGLR